LRTNDLDRMTLTSGGNIGIGTVNPNYLLHVSSGVLTIDGTGSGLNVEGYSVGLVARDLTNGLKIRLIADTTFGIMGTRTNHGMRLRTNDLDRMTLTSSGNVGIGTTDPQTKLEVNGSASFGSGPTKSTFTTSGQLNLVGNDSPFTVGGSTFVVTQGNVGIGTTNPTRKFQVDTVTQNTSGTAAFLSTALTDTQVGVIIVGRDQANNESATMQYTYDTTASDQLFALGFFGGSNNQLVLKGNGNVGIGTANPCSTCTLHVIGGISATADMVGRNLTLTGADSGSSTLSWFDPDVAGTGQVGAINTASNIWNFDAKNNVALSVKDDAGNIWLYGQDGGKVGIGTTGPTARLHVSRSNATGANNVLLVSSGTEAGQELMIVKGNGKVGIGTNNPNATLEIVQDGGHSTALYIRNRGTAIAFYDLNNGYVSSYFFDEGNTWQSNTNLSMAIKPARGNFTLNQNDDLRAVMTSVGTNAVANTLYLKEGNVGIGTTSPGAKLHVSSGAVIFDGAGSSVTVTPGGSGPAFIATNGPTKYAFGNNQAGSLGAVSWYINDVAKWSLQTNGSIASGGFGAGVGSGGPPANAWVHSGNVGINMTQPTEELVISENSGAAGPTINMYRSDTTIGTNNILATLEAGGNDSDTDASGVRAQIQAIAEGNAGATGWRIMVSSDNSTTLIEALRVNEVGNVGIGTTGPSSLLHIIGEDSSASNSSLDDLLLQLSRRAGSGENIGFRVKDGAGIAGVTGPAQIMSQGVNHFEIYTIEAIPLVLGTNTTERLRIDANGRVGIGTASPDARLEVQMGANDNYAVQISSQDGSDMMRFEQDGVGILDLRRGATLRLTNSNNTVSGEMRYGSSELLIQSNTGDIRFVSAGGKIETGANLLLTGIFTDPADERLHIHESINNVHGAYMVLSKSRTGTSGAVVSGDFLSQIFSKGGDGTDRATVGAKIVVQADGTIATNRVPASIQFHTAQGAVDNDISEKMRITPSGKVGIGTTPTELLEIQSPGNSRATARLDTGASGAGATTTVDYAENGVLYWSAGHSALDGYYKIAYQDNSLPKTSATKLALTQSGLFAFNPYTANTSTISTTGDLSLGGTVITYKINGRLTDNSGNIIRVSESGTARMILDASGGNGEVIMVAGATQKKSTFTTTGNLQVPGIIESGSGGFKFPDGTTQTTAGSSSYYRQFVSTTTFAFFPAQGTAIPIDDTIPQSDEGYTVLTATITPTRSDSRLKITTFILAREGINTSGFPIVATLFQDGGTSAIAVGSGGSTGISGSSLNGDTGHTVLTHIIENVGSTTQRYFSLNVGAQAANTVCVNCGSNTSINTTANKRIYGGAQGSYMYIEELAP